MINDPILWNLKAQRPFLWINPHKKSYAPIYHPYTEDALEKIDAHWHHFTPLLKTLFKEAMQNKDLVESSLDDISSFKGFQNLNHHRYLLKRDDLLPIAGSIKARGGIYEVLCHAETLALSHHLISKESPSLTLATPKVKALFSQHTIAVGSTGNLGLSIGIMSAKLGFKVNVHMSSDAKTWKKDLLRSHGVTVIEYDEDYSVAVTKGRLIADQDPLCYFIDDENSKLLFLGYAVAGLRLKEQLTQMNIQINEQNPLFVYLPCGVGGGPGGVAYGLKTIFKNNVHCFFAEPTQSPCMLLGMHTQEHHRICVQDIGLSNQTLADGLAVGRPSGFIGPLMMPLLSGIYTVEDQRLMDDLKLLYNNKGIFIEPSAASSLSGPRVLFQSPEGKAYLQSLSFETATHVMWSTGGSLVPEASRLSFIQ